MNPKKLGRALLCRMLENQVHRLRSHADFQIVAIAGSVGKTSTKLAIASVLSTKQRVIFQDGNYNDRVTVPLVLFERTEPAIFNVFAWLKILVQNEQTLRKPYPYDVAVLEIGTDGPGQLADFAYLHPDITVLTAIAAEHMEYFKSLEAVAREELTPVSYSKRALLSLDDIAPQFLPQLGFNTYGHTKEADYQLVDSRSRGATGQQLKLQLGEGKVVTFDTPLLGVQGHKIILAAAGVADMLGWESDDISEGLKQVHPVAGRLQLLSGQQDSQLLDDTYNASPIAVRAALDVLYGIEAPQRIAILGSMNELGDISAEAHRTVGEYCDPDKLELVVTIGNEAEKYLAPAAKDRGCQTVSFKGPYEAGAYVKQQLKSAALVLAKGSQNGVFAEEALKLLLKNPDDASKLVRQSPYWLSIKHRQFPHG